MPLKRLQDRQRATVRKNFAPRAILVAISVVFAGCSVHTPMPSLPDQTPVTWRNADAQAQGPAPDLQTWWHAFDDPTLDSLVQQALGENLGIQVAGLRLHAARSLQHRARTDFWPNLNFRIYEETAPGGSTGYFEMGFDAEWEFGLFGRSTGSARMTAADVNSAIIDEAAARVSVSAEVAKSYVELRASQARVGVADEVVALRRRRVELMEVRLRARMASQVEVDHAREEWHQALTDAREPALGVQQASQSLAVLLGKLEPESAWLQPTPQPQLPALDIRQAPADLLRTRPEIRRAEQNILRAAGELGIARADMYPKLGVAGTLISSTSVTGDIDHPNKAVPLLGPMISIPIFDWGARRDIINAREAALSASVLAYREAVLEGVAEVELALAQFADKTARLANADAALALARKTAQSAQTLGRIGLGDSVDETAAAIALADARLTQVTASSERSLAFIALYKAFGGVLPALDQGPP
jgi:NodT family efflux transporter outer membrane factor (OMF) lipoprotein